MNQVEGSRAMRILLVHNRYQQPGGEDAVFESESALLRRYGHEVQELVFDNDEIPASPSPLRSIQLGAETVWSRRSRARIARAVGSFRPHVVHFHNTFPLVSPAAYGVARAAGARVVQTLHNYRLLCAGANLLRDGHPCEACVGRRVALPALRHACYRGNRGATAAVVAMQAIHGALGTWRNNVDVFIAISEFAKAKMIAGGLPAEKIEVAPNFLSEDPGVGSGRGREVVFVSRLSEEKGVAVLLAAAERVPHVPLVIIGDGPMAPEVAAAAKRLGNVTWAGRLSPTDVLARMKDARALVVPSICYEGLPRVVVEAFAVGLPVVASAIGGLAEILTRSGGGTQVSPGEPGVLADAMAHVADSEDEIADMRRRARSFFLEHLDDRAHHAALMRIYRDARPSDLPGASR